MKRSIELLLTVAVAFGVGSTGTAQVRTISVSGTAEIRSAPDIVVWRVTPTEVEAKDIFPAKRRVETKVNS